MITRISLRFGLLYKKHPTMRTILSRSCKLNWGLSSRSGLKFTLRNLTQNQSKVRFRRKFTRKLSTMFGTRWPEFWRLIYNNHHRQSRSVYHLSQNCQIIPYRQFWAFCILAVFTYALYAARSDYFTHSKSTVLFTVPITVLPTRSQTSSTSAKHEWLRSYSGFKLTCLDTKHPCVGSA